MPSRYWASSSRQAARLTASSRCAGRADRATSASVGQPADGHPPGPRAPGWAVSCVWRSSKAGTARDRQAGGRLRQAVRPARPRRSSTIFPAGKLPAKCPPGMVKLGSYGSCRRVGGRAGPRRGLGAPDRAVREDPHLRDAGRHPGHRRRGQPGRPAGDDEGAGGDQPASTWPTSSRSATAPARPPTAAARGDHRPEPGGTGRRRRPASRCWSPPATAAWCRTWRWPTGSAMTHRRTPDTAAWDDSPWVTAVAAACRTLARTPASGSVRTRSGTKACSPRAPASPRCSPGPVTRTVSRRHYRQPHALGAGHHDGRPGRHLRGGADARTGVLALATQLNHGQNIGPLNPVLYQVLGPRRRGRRDCRRGPAATTRWSRTAR